MEKSYEEILRLLDRMGRSPTGLVFRGVRDYVGPAKDAREAEAVDDLIARARAGSPDDPLYVVAIAAISNVASALLKSPDIAEKIVVVWLGGHALDWPDTREFNLRQDVGGAQALFDSGEPLVLVPCMGVTSHLHSTVPEIERYVEPHGEIGRFLAERFKGYSDDHIGWSKEIWDMAAVALLLDPSWAPTSSHRLHPDGPGDLERGSEAPTHALYDDGQTRSHPEGLFLQIETFRGKRPDNLFRGSPLTSAF